MRIIKRIKRVFKKNKQEPQDIALNLSWLFCAGQGCNVQFEILQPLCSLNPIKGIYVALEPCHIHALGNCLFILCPECEQKRLKGKLQLKWSFPRIEQSIERTETFKNSLPARIPTFY